MAEKISKTRNRRCWTPEEDEIIIKKLKEFGNKWTVIAQFLSGRVDVSIKHRWNRVLSKKIDYSSSDTKFNDLQFQALNPFFPQSSIVREE